MKLRDILLDRIKELSIKTKDKKNYVLYASFDNIIVFVKDLTVVDIKNMEVYDLSNSEILNEEYDRDDEYDSGTLKLTSEEYLEIQQMIINDDERVFTDGGDEGNSQYYFFYDFENDDFIVNSEYTHNTLFTKQSIKKYRIIRVFVEDNLV